MAHGVLNAGGRRGTNSEVRWNHEFVKSAAFLFDSFVKCCFDQQKIRDLPFVAVWFSLLGMATA